MGIKGRGRSGMSRDSNPACLCCSSAHLVHEGMKEAVTTVIDMLTQEDFHGAFQKLLERYDKSIAAGDYFEGD